MSQQNDLTCDTCKFARVSGEYGYQCFRFPPQPFCQVAMDGTGNVHWDNLRPFVSKGEIACGEHSA